MSLMDILGSESNLQERVREDLKLRFPGILDDYELGSSNAADLVIEQGDIVAVVELKTGDPSFSLPSSTSPRMRLLRDEIGTRFRGKIIVPVVVTNYQVQPDEKQKLEREGIKIVQLPRSMRNYRPEQFSTEFIKAAGLDPGLSDQPSSPTGTTVV